MFVQSPFGVEGLKGSVIRQEQILNEVVLSSELESKETLGRLQ